MNASHRLLHQLKSFWDRLSSIQRAALGGAGFLLAVGLLLLASHGGSGKYVPLSWGKEFTAEELRRVKDTLLKENLRDFQQNGRQLLVPKSQVEAYNAALLKSDNVPEGFTSEWEEQFEKSNLFTSQDELRAMKDIALRKELRRIIRAVPAIDDARVIWARSERQQWPAKERKVTATVNVRPRSGERLSPSLIHSLRSAVAHMVPDLKMADVTVFDQSTGISYSDEGEDGGLNGRRLQQMHRLTRTYQQQIARALSYIPDVKVTVGPDPEILDASLSQAQQHPTEKAEYKRKGGVRQNERSFAQRSAVSKAVRVSVDIPKSYYRAVARQQGLKPGQTESERHKFRQAVARIRSREEQKARETAWRFLPQGMADDAVQVSSYVKIDTPSSPAKPSSGNKFSGTAGWTALTVIVSAVFGIGFWFALRRTTSGGQIVSEATVPGDFEEPESAENAPTRFHHDVPRLDSRFPSASRFPNAVAGSRLSQPAMTQTFEDLLDCPASVIREAFHRCSRRQWAIALQGTSGQVVEAVTEALAPSDAAALQGEMDRLGPVRLADLEAAQQEVLAAFEHAKLASTDV